MAHVQMHQYHSNEPGVGQLLADYGKQKRQLAQSERESRRAAGVSLQNAQAKLDNDREIAKIHETNQLRMARMRAGFDLQMKQMGIDTEVLIQKLRNMNAMEIEEFRAKVQRDIEMLKNKNIQSQILKTYQTNLELHKYDAKAAMAKTYVDTLGRIYQTGDPISNAADTAAYAAWVIAFNLALRHAGLTDTLDVVGEPQNLDSKLTDSLEVGGQNDKSVEEELKRLKTVLEQQTKDRKGNGTITRYPKIKLKTKIKMFENDRAGNKEKR